MRVPPPIRITSSISFCNRQRSQNSHYTMSQTITYLIFYFSDSVAQNISLKCEFTGRIMTKCVIRSQSMENKLLYCSTMNGPQSSYKQLCDFLIVQIPYFLKIHCNSQKNLRQCLLCSSTGKQHITSKLISTNTTDRIP